MSNQSQQNLMESRSKINQITPSKNSDKTTQRSWYTIEDIAENANEAKRR